MIGGIVPDGLKRRQQVRHGALIRRRRPAPRPQAPLDLLVVGAGGMGRAIASLCAQDIDEAGRPRWNVLGFIDEDTALHGSFFEGLPVLGGLRTVARYPTAQLVVSICHVDHHGARRRIVEALGLPAHRYATVVHRSAVIDPSCRIGHGVVVMPMVCALPGGTIGNHVIVRPQTMMSADVSLRDYATVAAQVFLGRGVVVEENAYVGAGAKVRERARVAMGRRRHGIPRPRRRSRTSDVGRQSAEVPGAGTRGAPARVFRGARGGGHPRVGGTCPSWIWQRRQRRDGRPQQGRADQVRDPLTGSWPR
ncbi:PglD-related sugar-binding protein [Actinacidiphila soli]|uniref:PglD-related sugar-binding protein n=1 Tax=Actinacidiphila soli TaxID=2487275 RepID=UPI001F0B9F8B|nr:hypothetical protein [Actinacidiphila soli]